MSVIVSHYESLCNHVLLLSACSQVQSQFTLRYLLPCSKVFTEAHVGAGKGTFTAAVEVQGQKQLVVSFLHHQAVQRLSHNPLEQQDVVGVTNYLDVGLQV